MNLEAVTVCIGYGDFLAHTASYNAGLLDHWLIVTSKDDHETRDVCRRHGLPTLLSEDHHRKGEDFNKGRLIERGLQHLSADGWRMHLDADIILPHRLRQLLKSAHLHEDKIYGCDRVMVKSYADWQKLRNSGWVGGHHAHHCVTPPAGFDLGSRWSHIDGGFTPIGFMQLWHSSADQYNGIRNRPYPSRHNDACRADVQHALQWDRRLRELLPELLVVHLESEACPNGTNWKGRKTKRFGPCAPKNACRHPYMGETQ